MQIRNIQTKLNDVCNGGAEGSGAQTGQSAKDRKAGFYEEVVRKYKKEGSYEDEDSAKLNSDPDI